MSDEMVYMKAILTFYMYIQFENTFYFLRDYVRITFLSTKKLEVTEVKGMFCNRVIAIVTVLTIFCSMVVTIEKQIRKQILL